MQPLSRLVIFTATFLVAACSIAYELAIARMVAQLAGNPVIWESITIGLYILSLGVGALLFEYQKRKWGDSLLLRTEILLTITGAMAGFVVLALHVSYRIFYYDDGMLRSVLPVPPILAFTLPAQLMTILVGFLSGLELPALLQAAATTGMARSDAKVLGAYYAGTLFGTAAFGLSHKFNLDDLYTGLGAAALNLIVAAALVPTAARGWRIFTGATLASIALFLAGLFSLVPAVTQIHAKNFYYNQHQWRSHGIAEIEEFFPVSLWDLKGFLDQFPLIERYRSPYQVIDVVQPGPSVFDGSPPASGFTLYINGRFQLSAATADDYHQTLANTPIELTGTQPRSILILGGGDGVLAAELLKRSEVRAITLVDIDPLMVELARTHHQLLALNRGALDDARVQVIIDDAFNVLRRSDTLYDAIYFDVTFPFDFDSARLSTVEMFSMARRHLQGGGFVAAPSPLDLVNGEDATFEEVATGTLGRAGFKQLVAFRAKADPFFVATTWRTDRPLSETDHRLIELSGDASTVHSLLKPSMYQVQDPFF